MLKRFQKTLGLNKAFLVFIFIFCYFSVIKTRFNGYENINWYLITPEGPISLFISALVVMLLVRITIKKMVNNQDLPFSAATYLKVGSISFFTYLIISNLSGLVIATLFDTIDRNFNSRVLTKNNLSSVIDFVLFSSLYLVYHHMKKAATYQTNLAIFNEELAQNKLKQLSFEPLLKLF